MRFCGGGGGGAGKPTQRYENFPIDCFKVYDIVEKASTTFPMKTYILQAKNLRLS